MTSITILTVWMALGGPFGLQAQGSEGVPPAIVVTIDKVNVVDVAQDHLQLGVSLTLNSATDVAVREITFEGVQLNGLPVYLAPIQERIELKSKQPLQIPDPLRVSLYFRDVDSVRPLQAMISDRRVRFEGTIYFEAEIPALVRVLLFGRRVRIPVRFQQDIPVNVPESALMQSVMLRALGAASSLMGGVGSVVESALSRTAAWRDQLWREVAPRLLFGYVKFALRDRDGRQTVLEFSGTGFRVSSNQFVFCKNLVEPWKFDPDIVAAIKHDGLSLIGAEYDLWVWPVNAIIRNSSNQLDPSSGFRLTKSDFQIVRQPNDTNRSLYALRPEGRPRKITIHKRDSSANLVLFQFRTPANALEDLKIIQAENTNWDRVAIFRFPGGIYDKQARADLIFLPASLADSRIKLSTPVDSSAWGSPVIIQGGILGFVQDETTAIPLKEAFQALRLK